MNFLRGSTPRKIRLKFRLAKSRYLQSTDLLKDAIAEWTERGLRERYRVIDGTEWPIPILELERDLFEIHRPGAPTALSDSNETFEIER